MAYSVGRLFWKFSNITWIWLPSVLSIILVSKDSEEEDDDNKKDKYCIKYKRIWVFTDPYSSVRENTGQWKPFLAYFMQWKLLSSRSMFLEEGSDSSDNEDEKVVLRQRLLFECLFLCECFAYLCLVVLPLYFCFAEIPSGSLCQLPLGLCWTPWEKDFEFHY